MVKNLEVGDTVRYWDFSTRTFYTATIKKIDAKTAVVDISWAKGKRVNLTNLYPLK